MSFLPLRKGVSGIIILLQVAETPPFPSKKKNCSINKSREFIFLHSKFKPQAILFTTGIKLDVCLTQATNTHTCPHNIVAVPEVFSSEFLVSGNSKAKYKC